MSLSNDGTNRSQQEIVRLLKIPHDMKFADRPDHYFGAIKRGDEWFWVMDDVTDELAQLRSIVEPLEKLLEECQFGITIASSTMSSEVSAHGDVIGRGPTLAEALAEAAKGI